MTSLTQSPSKLIRVHWSQNINGINGSQNLSIICPQSLELMEFLYLTCCVKKTIQMQTGASTGLLKIQ